MEQTVYQQAVPLLELRKDCCKFPVIGPDRKVIGLYLFCAAPTRQGAVYCLKHHEIAVPRGGVRA